MMKHMQKGEFYTHYTDHRQFDDHFFELYHMTVVQFDELLYKVGEQYSPLLFPLPVPGPLPPSVQSERAIKPKFPTYA